jgi:ATP-dependent DNA helicase DinG
MPVREVIEQIVSQLPGYEPRPQQRRMAELVEQAISEGRHALIEAGTGSGKSFGYLVPLLESGQTAVIATGTIALQEQLLNKDIPFLEQAYGRPIRTALAKGRGNYVCMRKLDETAQGLSPADPRFPVVQQMAADSRGGAWNGDRAELPFVVDGRFWHDQIASDPFDCLGPKCPNYQFTPHRMARLALESAQIIVANHALYFTDLAQGGGLLPQHQVVVFDEAHHLDRAAVGALTTEVNRWEANRLLQRAQRRFPGLPPRIAQGLGDAESDLMEFLFRRGRGQYKLERDPEFEAKATAMARAVARLAMWLQAADASQMALLDSDPETAQQRATTQRDQMRSVAEDLGRRWDHFAELRLGDQRANWIMVDPVRDYYEINSAPLHVGALLDQMLWSQKTCVLTSATLAVDGRFDFLRQELGLPRHTLDAVLGSPFDFPRQALFYVPPAMPQPSDGSFTTAAAAEIERILAMTEGRAFVLCTSYRSMREISAQLAGRIPYQSRTQEDLPRARLIEWFKTTPNAVLFATATFWEGVDVPGDALSCVIIDKLPFSNPDDPVVQARTDRMKAQDQDWFGEFVLPKAVLALKQGFGRLIRTRTDTGLVALLDRRVLTMRYGQVVLRSLPPARRISTLSPTLAEALAAPATPASGPPQSPAPSVRSAPPDDLEATLALFDRD